MVDDLDHIFKALADPTRRQILDMLRDGPQTTTEIVRQFPQLSRFGVMKHMDVLREADLIVTTAKGRTRENALNALPIRRIAERWISRFDAFWANHLLRFREDSKR